MGRLPSMAAVAVVVEVVAVDGVVVVVVVVWSWLRLSAELAVTEIQPQVMWFVEGGLERL